MPLIYGNAPIMPAEYHVSGEEAEKTLKNAELFVDEVKKVLSKEM